MVEIDIIPCEDKKNHVIYFRQSQLLLAKTYNEDRTTSRKALYNIFSYLDG